MNRVLSKLYNSSPKEVFQYVGKRLGSLVYSIAVGAPWHDERSRLS